MAHIVLAGGSGFLGRYYQRYLESKNQSFMVLTRNPKTKNDIYWDGKNLGKWVSALEGADMLINLSGSSIDCIHNKKNQELILNSRIQSVNALANACKQLTRPPRYWFQASAIGIYGSTVEETDEKGSFGKDFLANTCKNWEDTFLAAELNKTKKVILRIGLVLGASGGIYKKLAPLVKFFLGGHAGSGCQWMSWVHFKDVINTINFIMEKNFEGVFNLCAPTPVTNSEFMRVMRRVHSRPWSPPVPEFILRLVLKFILRVESSLVFNSSRCVPEALQKRGFKFEFDQLEKALRGL